MNKIQLDLIAGTRPNFMKIAPIISAIKKKQDEGVEIDFRLVHTGQHYDRNMSGAFFDDLEIPEPDINLGAGGGTQAEQTAAIMIRYESLLMKSDKPRLCIVVGDVTSTMACTITARKMGIEVAHVEGGIRSWDLTMPEEINRIVTDSIANYFFVTSKTAETNLLNSGIDKTNIFFVGNTMIDTLLKFRSCFRKPQIFEKASLSKGNYFVLTMHRPANVDEKSVLKKMVDQIIHHSKSLPIIFPVHPRTRAVLDEMNITHPRLWLVDPLGYLEFNYLVEHSKAVITDSGGITEETTVMGIPCMTLRNNTERPETIDIGTNELIGTNPDAISPAMKKLFDGNWKSGSIPNLWDGKTSERIIEILINLPQT